MHSPISATNPSNQHYTIQNIFSPGTIFGLQVKGNSHEAILDYCYPREDAGYTESSTR
jgi:hypothetical protein